MDPPSSTSPPTPKPRVTICPYCGSRSRSLAACESCRGKFDPLSRQATQNAMGPWFIRDEDSPYRPGCSHETLVRLIQRGEVRLDTVLRGPASRQFWTLARWCPGVAHLLGVCHSCQRAVEPDATGCAACGASFRLASDRQQLGLGEVRFVPGRSEPVAAATEAAPAGVDDLGGTSPGGAGGDAPAIDHRVVRLERELRRARRWRLGWMVCCVLLAAGVGGVLLFRALDLEAGPVGRWLRADRQVEVVNPPDDLVTPITLPSGTEATAEPGGATGGETSGDTPGEGSEEAAPGAEPGDLAPESVPDPDPGIDPGDGGDQVAGGGLDLSALASLRRLR